MNPAHDARWSITALGAVLLASPTLAGPVIIDFESLNQSGVYVGDTWLGGTTTRIDNQFLALGIDFNGAGSGLNHTNLFFGTGGGDGDISLLNAFRVGTVDTWVPTIEMTAVGDTWRNFSMMVLTTAPVTLSAYGTGGQLLQALPISTATGWETFSFTVGGIASVEATGAGGDILLDAITYTPENNPVIPLPSAALAGMAGLCLVAARRTHRSMGDRLVC